MVTILIWDCTVENRRAICHKEKERMDQKKEDHQKK